MNITVKDTTPRRGERLTGFGLKRYNYLKEMQPVTAEVLTMHGILYAHCLEVDEEAWDRVDELVKQMAKAEGATEQLKRENQLRWVGIINNCRARAFEIVEQEMIYV